MISIQRLEKSFDGGRTFAVRDVSLEVQSGETLVLLGSSGSGKTTTLKMINRLIEPTGGTIEIDGRDVVSHDLLTLRRSIGYVFQGIGLFPHMSVEENVAVVLRLMGWSRARRRRRAHELLDLVELDPAEYAHRYPRHLSGGQQQRVGVARALAADPAHLLMDEPFGALDALTRDSLQQEVLRLKHRLGKTIVFVTHDIFEALIVADRIGVMHAGRLEQVGTKAEILSSPATPFVAELFAKPARQLAMFKEQLL
jgi:osmoprotectant transport system ATP-binding protein